MSRLLYQLMCEQHVYMCCFVHIFTISTVCFTTFFTSTGCVVIRINNICPGYLKTSMTNKSFKNQVLKQKRDARMILKRWGTPNDLVGPCIFLASDASSYITGIDLIVDGGWVAKGL